MKKITILLLLMYSSTMLANDFPTSARADYVFACMASNGRTQAILVKCSCVIDEIAKHVSYRQYEDIETIMQMRLMPGERTALFKDSEWAVNAVSHFNQVQANAELTCF